MTLGFVFWILMLLWFAFGLWSSWPFTAKGAGEKLLLFVLLILLGWNAFGPPIHS